MAAIPRSRPPASDLPELSHSLIERSPVPMAELAGAGHTVGYVNPAFCRLVGKPKEALLGNPFAETMQEGDTCLAVLDRVYRTGEAATHTEPEHPGSHPVYWSYAMWPVLGADRHPAGVMMQVTETTRFHRQAGAMNEALVLSSVRQHELTEEAEKLNEQLQEEIADRKAVNEALRASEERYRTLFDLGPVAVYSCDAAGVIQQFNRRAAELWGREPAFGDTDKRFCGSYKLFRPDGSFMPHEQCPMAEVLSGKISETHDAEVLIERPDGSRVTVVVNIRPLKNERGEIAGAINCFYDITDRKRQEEEQARLAAIVEFSDDAIVSKDLNGIIVSWNRGAERIFGYAPNEAIGKPVTMLIPRERHDEEPEILARLRRGERIEHYETVRRRKHGSFIDVALTVSPIRNAAGKIVGASKIARDITERKRGEAHRDMLRHELSHRIKNALATVQSIAIQTLRGVPTLAAFEEAFIARLIALSNTHDLLTKAEWQGAAVHDVIAAELAPYQTAGHARWTVDGPDIQLDPSTALALGMAFHELATNAAKHGALSNENGEIKVRWRCRTEKGRQRLQLRWVESGGPAVEKPARKGLGTRLLAEGLAFELDGEVQLDFDPAGVCCTIDVPLERAGKEDA